MYRQFLSQLLAAPSSPAAPAAEEGGGGRLLPVPQGTPQGAAVAGAVRGLPMGPLAAGEQPAQQKGLEPRLQQGEEAGAEAMEIEGALPSQPAPAAPAPAPAAAQGQQPSSQELAERQQTGAGGAEDPAHPPALPSMGGAEAPDGKGQPQEAAQRAAAEGGGRGGEEVGSDGSRRTSGGWLTGSLGRWAGGWACRRHAETSCLCIVLALGVPASGRTASVARLLCSLR